MGGQHQSGRLRPGDGALLLELNSCGTRFGFGLLEMRQSNRNGALVHKVSAQAKDADVSYRHQLHLEILRKTPLQGAVVNHQNLGTVRAGGEDGIQLSDEFVAKSS